MKKTLLLLAFTVLGTLSFAQETDLTEQEETGIKQVRKKFFNFSYSYERIKPTDSEFGLGDISDEVGSIANDEITGIRNNWGISLTRGRSYMLHKKPILRLISIGIDASFFDVSYSNYTFDQAANELFFTDTDSDADSDAQISDDAYTFHKMEYSFQVGPSITITPGKSLTIEAYARYAPTFAAFYANKSFGGNYASLFVTGASISYRKVGVGIEARMGSCKYKTFSGDMDLSGIRIKNSGFRAYLQLRW